MENVVGKALGEFEAGLLKLQGDLKPYPDVDRAVFEGSEDWRDLLTYKLVPHLAGDGCLVVAVTGGTNTGKSTLFNLLVGEQLSPMASTAAATCHPVVAASESRGKQCLEGKLVPEFDARPLTDPSLATDAEISPDALFVAVAGSLSDSLILMDTPDVDSIVKRNWEVADHIRAAGDVIVAVVTGEKYKDQRVVEYFCEAVASSRIVIPVMNKANPANDFSVAREQLDSFRADVGTDQPRFVVEHDFSIGENVARKIVSVDQEMDLRLYLENLDVARIKEQVFEGTIARFSDQAVDFLKHTDSVAADLRGVTDHFDALAAEVSKGYTPAPGKEVGGLFHAFVQSKRGPIRKAIGNGSAAIAKGAAAVGQRLTSALRKRATLESESELANETLKSVHRESVERIVRELVTRSIEMSGGASDTARSLLVGQFENLDADAAVEAVVGEVLGSEGISNQFREYANETLETWWEDHKGKRRALEALDTILAIMPAAIAAPIALHTGGLGVSEAMVIAGPLAAQFMTRVMEYQFGDALFGFLSPWKVEQQEKLCQSLAKHVMGPSLGALHSALEPLEGGAVDDLRRSLEQCLRP